MASSKQPHEFVEVHPDILALEKRFPSSCVANIRRGETGEFFPHESENRREAAYREYTRFTDGEMIGYRFFLFLASIHQTTRVAIYYQGYGKTEHTVIVDLEPIRCWAAQCYPRLDFEQPANWNHCPNFWGGFVLALGTVEDIDTTDVVDDPEGHIFAHIMTNHAKPIQVTSYVNHENIGKSGARVA